MSPMKNGRGNIVHSFPNPLFAVKLTLHMQGVQFVFYVLQSCGLWREVSGRAPCSSVEASWSRERVISSG